MTEQRRYVPSFVASTVYKSLQALTFDGISDWAAVLNIFGADTFKLFANQPFSMSFWVKPTNASAVEQTIASRWTPHPTLWVNEGGWKLTTEKIPIGGSPARSLSLVLASHRLSSFWIYSDENFPVNVWVHVAVTYDGSGSISGLRWFWDGVEKSYSTVIANWVGSMGSGPYSHLLWGCHYSNWHAGSGGPVVIPPVLGKFWEGVQDEPSIWRHELTPTEVLRLYHEGRPANPLHVGLPTKHANGWWRFGEPRDGVFILDLGISYSREPQPSTPRNVIWNNFATGRVTTDVPP